VKNEVGSALCGEGETVEVLNSNTAPQTRKTVEGEIDWDFDTSQEDYEFKFENEQGQIRLLRFRVQVEE